MDEREWINQLLSQMQRLSDANWHILDEPCRAMDDKAWVGPSGRRFDADVHGHARSVQRELRAAIDVLRDKLNRTPGGVA